MNDKAIWSDLAKEDYWENIDYLLDEFTEKEAIEFIAKVDAIIDVITENPKTFQKSDYKGIHFVPFIPQITLYYRAETSKKVELVRFWNNYQDPERLKL